MQAGFASQTSLLQGDRCICSAVRRWNDAEIEKSLQTLVILVDTREKRWEHIGAALDKLGCPYERKKLDFGDYSYRYTRPDGTKEDMSGQIALERKASLDEICGNFTYGRERFAREFQRAKDSGAEVHLLVEDANWGKIKNHLYLSRLHPEALQGNLFSWLNRYDLRLWFSPTAFAGELIYKLFRYHLRNRLQEEMEEGGEDADPERVYQNT